MKLESLLQQTDCHPVIEPCFQFGQALIVDLSQDSDIWHKVTADHDFEQEIKRQIQQTNAVVEIGRYNEQRRIYQDTEHFSEQQARCLHIGIDLGIPAGNPVFAPLDGEVYGYADNHQQGDYGPTIVLRHQLEEHVFYTLYGHLTRSSLDDLAIGKPVAKGQAFAQIGTREENGGWATHLHFQIIKDMGEKTTDYPGVVAPQESEFYLNNCPNPNLILKRSDLPS